MEERVVVVQPWAIIGKQLNVDVLKGLNYSHHLELFHFHYDVAPGEKEGDEWGDETGCTLAHPATWKSESEDFDIKNVLAMSGENGGKNI